MRPAFNAPELNQIVRPWCMPLGLMLGLALNGCAASSTVLDPPPQAQEVAAWPVALDATEGLIELYQPQPECMERDTLSARAVVSLTRPGAAAPLFGAVWFTAQVATDLDARTATIRKVTVGDVCLPGPMSAMQQEFALAIGKRLSTAEVTYPLDELTATLDTGHLEQVETNRIRTAPPRILFSTTPATLISVNGPPRLQPVEGRPGVARVVARGSRSRSG